MCALNEIFVHYLFWANSNWVCCSIYLCWCSNLPIKTHTNTRKNRTRQGVGLMKKGKIYVKYAKAFEYDETMHKVKCAVKSCSRWFAHTGLFSTHCTSCISCFLILYQDEWCILITSTSQIEMIETIANKSTCVRFPFESGSSNNHKSSPIKNITFHDRLRIVTCTNFR